MFRWGRERWHKCNPLDLISQFSHPPPLQKSFRLQKLVADNYRETGRLQKTAQMRYTKLYFQHQAPNIPKFYKWVF
jgi:hypothetical protein